MITVSRAAPIHCGVRVHAIAEQTTGKMSTNELLKGLTALREKVDPSVLEKTLKGAPTQTAVLVAR